MKKLFLLIALALPLMAVAQEMKIMSFNVRYNSAWADDGENRWANRRDAAAQMILEEHPVAIGLQEALIDQLKDLDELLPGYQRVGVGRDDGKEDGEFMAIYYDEQRLELQSCKTFWLSEKPKEPSRGWDAACNRMVTVARFLDHESGMEFYYLNTHLDHVGKKARAEAAKMIAGLVKEEAGDMPVILGGDMNTKADDEIFKNFYIVGLQAARDIPEETSYANTYNAFGKGEGSMIDHFFVRHMKVDRFVTLDGDYGVPYVSDHYPIEMIVSF